MPSKSESDKCDVVRTRREVYTGAVGAQRRHHEIRLGIVGKEHHWRKCISQSTSPVRVSIKKQEKKTRFQGQVKVGNWILSLPVPKSYKIH